MSRDASAIACITPTHEMSMSSFLREQAHTHRTSGGIFESEAKAVVEDDETIAKLKKIYIHTPPS
jgi:hypothetical protein